MSLSPSGWVLEDGVRVAVVRLAKHIVLVRACIERVHTCRASWGMRSSLVGKQNMLHRPLITHCSGHPVERRFCHHWCGNTLSLPTGSSTSLVAALEKKNVPMGQVPILRVRMGLGEYGRCTLVTWRSK